MKIDCCAADVRHIFIAKSKLKYLYVLTRLMNLWFMNSLGQFQQSPISTVTFKSPEMLAPARMPVAAGKKMAKTEKKDSAPRKSGVKFSMNMFAAKKTPKKYP